MVSAGRMLAAKTIEESAYRVLFSYVNFGQGATLAVIIALICFAIAAFYARQLNIEEA